MQVFTYFVETRINKCKRLSITSIEDQDFKEMSKYQYGFCSNNVSFSMLMDLCGKWANETKSSLDLFFTFRSNANYKTQENIKFKLTKI